MLTLVSASSARRELLSRITREFAIGAHQCAETVESDDPEQHARRCALGKIEASQPGNEAMAFVISADTVFSVGQRMLGKPASREQARIYLEMLSAGSAEVHTATAVKKPGHPEPECRIDRARIKCRRLDGRDIDHWLADSDPTLYAGAFALQSTCAEWVEEFSGDYSTVVGLNLRSARALLFGAEAAQSPQARPSAALERAFCR